MKKIKHVFPFVFVLSLLVSMQEGHTQHPQHHSNELGTIEFSLSCSQEASDIFHEGLALLHHMMYEQAEAEFKRVTETDPDCAMSYWGIAMSVIHPLWGERPSDEELKKGTNAIDQAKAIGLTDKREAAYVSAVEPFFKDWETTSYADQLASFERGFLQLYEAYPDDINAAAFYALGHLATAPKEDQTFSHQKKAGTLLEKLHKKAPLHPGLFHYTIHAYDNPVLADRALKVAREYDQIAPEVPHALHMPSHIFVRLGIWPDVISWNVRSADAALKQPVDNATSMHYAHALDYLAYAHLQRGEDEKAKKILHQMNRVDNLQQNFAAAYGVAAIYTRYHLEREKWKEAAALSVDVPNGFPLHKYPAAESIIHFTRGIGSAISGDIESAGRAVDELNEVYNTLLQADESYWAVLTDAQRTAVKAWMKLSEGDEETALVLMKEAADKEDSVDKHAVTPGHVLPARELLGDMLLKVDQPAQALKTYQSSLESSANRFRSLYGIARAAELLGQKELALSSYEELVAISADTPQQRPQLEQAKQFIAAAKN